MEKHFVVVESKLDIQRNDMCVMRYSALPYYKEQDRDIRKAGAWLVNSRHQHDWIADIGEWAGEHGLLEGLTPPAWTSNEFAMKFDLSGSFVVKGATNSRKNAWNTMMFAEEREDVGTIVAALSRDTMIGQQDIYVRPFVPLKTFCTGLNGMPVTNEYRFFICNGVILCGGFYWSSHIDDIRGLVAKANTVPHSLLEEVIRRIGSNASFYTIDVAEKTDGTWMVVELNDGQMSGLSECDPELLYERLCVALDA